MNVVGLNYKMCFCTLIIENKILEVENCSIGKNDDMLNEI